MAFHTIVIDDLPTFVLDADETDLGKFKSAVSGLGNTVSHRSPKNDEKARLIVLKIEAEQRGEDPDNVVGAPIRDV